MPISYKIDTSKKFVLEVWFDEVKVRDIHQIIENELPFYDLPEGMKALFEIDYSTITYTLSDLVPTVNLLKNSHRNLRNARWAFLTNAPKTTAFLLYFKRISQVLPIEIEVFSTIDGALNWLDASHDQYRDMKTKLITTVIPRTLAI